MRFPEAGGHPDRSAPAKAPLGCLLCLVIILYVARDMIYHGALRSDAGAKTGKVG